MVNLDAILQQVLSFTGTFNPQLVICLFVICALGEFAASIPYVLETMWLLSGYHVGTGILSPWHLPLLWLVAQAGRQSGATSLYHLSRFGSMPLMKLYHKYFAVTSSQKLPNNNMPFKLFRRLNLLSPFSVALGRLFWLRIPLTLTLSVKKQLKTLSLGVVLSSLVFDGIYISLGIAGSRAVLKPIDMVLYSLIGLTLLYAVTFVIRRLYRLWSARENKKCLR